MIDKEIHGKNEYRARPYAYPIPIYLQTAFSNYLNISCLIPAHLALDGAPPCVSLVH